MPARKKKKKAAPPAPPPRRRRAVAAAEWRAKALEAYADGSTVFEVARDLGHSVSSVRKAITAHLERVTQGYADRIKELRELKSVQLDAVIKGSLPDAKKGVTSAAFVVIAAIEKQTKLHGLAAAEKVDVTAKVTVAYDSVQVLLDRLSKYRDPGAASDAPNELQGASPAAPVDDGAPAGGDAPDAP